MKKNYYFIILIGLFFIISCDESIDENSSISNELRIKQILFASSKNVKEEDLFYAVFENISDNNNYKIVDTKGSAIGIDPPDWYKYMNDSSNLKSLYNDYLIFIYQDSGKNLNSISREIDTIKINSLFNNYINEKISSYFNTKELLFSGLKKEGDWWILIDNNGDRIYQYTTIYLMSKDIFNSQLSKYLNK